MTEKDLPVLKSLCVDKTRRAAQESTLKSNPQLIFVLDVWRMWGAEAEVHNWCAQLIASDDGLHLLISKLLEQPRYIRDGKHHHPLSVDRIKEFAAPSLVAERMEHLPLEGFGNEARNAVETFRSELRSHMEQSTSYPEPQVSSNTQ